MSKENMKNSHVYFDFDRLFINDGFNSTVIRVIPLLLDQNLILNII